MENPAPGRFDRPVRGHNDFLFLFRVQITERQRDDSFFFGRGGGNTRQEMAVRYVEANGGAVHVVSVGDSGNQTSLRSCLSVGAKDAFLVSDPKFAGADGTGIAKILAAAVPKVEALAGAKFDVIICGMESTDSINGHVGAILAEKLGYAYVSGVVAGMKVQQLVDDGKLTDDNYDKDGKVKIGYVGAFNYAEVVSGYTAFYLGLTSVYPDAHMYVDYTNSWFDVDAEAATAEKLIADGCVIIGQHADSTGAPSAVEQAFQDGKAINVQISFMIIGFVRILLAPVENNKTAATHAFQDGTGGEMQLFHQKVVVKIPSGDG